MKICSNCQSKNKDDSIYCEHCGHKLDDITTKEETTDEGDYVTCPKCNMKSPKGSTYCQFCGTNITTATKKISKSKDNKKRINLVNNIFILIVSCFLLIGVFSPLIDCYSNHYDRIYIFSFFESQYFEGFITINNTYYTQYAFMREVLHALPLILGIGGLVFTLLFSIKSIITCCKNLINNNEESSSKNVGIACVGYIGMIYSLLICIPNAVDISSLPSFILFLIVSFSIASAIVRLILDKDNHKGTIIASTILRLISSFFLLSSISDLNGAFFTHYDNYSFNYSTLPEYLISSNNNGLTYAFSIILIILAIATCILICLNIFFTLHNIDKSAKKNNIKMSVITISASILLFIITAIFISPLSANNGSIIGSNLFSFFTESVFAFGFGLAGYLLTLKKEKALDKSE